MMIDHGWFEEPFTAADREELSKNSSGVYAAASKLSNYKINPPIIL